MVKKTVRHVSLASSRVDGNLATVMMPISTTLDVSSLIAALQQFEKWELLNTFFFLTGQGAGVEFKFKRRLEEAKQ